MLRILAMLALFFASSFASQAAVAADHECETSCSPRCISLVDDYERIAQLHRDYCDGGQVDCIPSCLRRYADGTCREYGQDFCARNPVCVPKCLNRYADGSCREYTADACGQAPVNCVARCTARYADGSCRTYGEDACGRNASCRASCTARYPDGACRTWGADQCLPQ